MISNYLNSGEPQQEKDLLFRDRKLVMQGRYSGNLQRSKSIVIAKFQGLHLESDNHGQNIWKEVKKSSNIRQE